MNFANAIAGGARGGPGKVAVVSSSLFGTISGLGGRQRHGRRLADHSR